MKNFILIAIAVVGLISLTMQVSMGDDDHDERYSLFKRQPGVAPVQNALYEQECSTCHFAYPPGLLPENSWRRIMSNLEDHFGDNAELIDTDRSAIQEYLINNSADKSGNRRSKKIARSASDTPPTRITQLRYFKHEHDEIPARMVKDNPKVGSFSQCDRCHSDAKEGYFSENRIRIPGFGRWDD
jgi:hypothetical protein